MNEPLILVDQASNAPTRKVAFAGIAGALTFVILWGLGQFGVTFPAGMESAMTVIVSSVIAYFTRDKAQPPLTNVVNLPKVSQ
jgi:hypothetical protein